MKFCYSTLLVKNMEESLAFYRDVLGLQVAERIQVMPGLELSFLNTGETQIELVMNEESQTAVVGSAVSLGFEVDSLDSTLEMLREKNIPLHSGPFVHPTVRFIFIQDPNGLKIQLKETLG